MKDNRSKLQIKLAAAKKLFMWHYLNRPLNLVLLTEFPKSGGSWFGQMLSDASNLPFPRNISPKLEESILHGHHLHHKDFGKVIAVMRDGRDVMVSAYYHFLFDNDRNSSYGVIENRKRLNFRDYNDIRTNLPQFIDFMFTVYGKERFHITWSEAVNSFYDNPDVCIIKYEYLLENAPAELEKALNFLGLPEKPEPILKQIVENYSFNSQSKRKPGQENNKSFLRKGIAGDWENNFSREASLVFEKFAGKELIKAGYEKDNSWLEKEI